MWEQILANQFIFEFSPHMVAVSVFILATLMLFVAVVSIRKVWISATLPILLVIVATLFLAIHNISGQPTERDFRGTFEFKAFTVDDRKEWIYIWGVEEGINHPITTKTPYTKELHRSLSEAKTIAKTRQVVGERGSGGTQAGKYEFHIFNLKSEDEIKLKQGKFIPQ